MKKLIKELLAITKTENNIEIENSIITISKILKKTYFGMDDKSEMITKMDIINDLKKYLLNPNDKTQINIRIFFLTQLLKNE